MTSIPKDLECIIETKDGPICGYIDEKDNRTYYKFKSIPYAKPPIGRLRFLPPSPIQPWKDVMDCTRDAPLPMCLLLNKESLCSITGSEDCLYIEVFTPNIKSQEPLPVMFWIGSYSFAYYIDNMSATHSTLTNDQNVIFVRCGFRLGPFGFLSINDYVAPGNCGLKDLVMALKWVQRNIGVFGGDPNNVTIVGDASGGAIVHFMMLSPMATGLFHKAIIKSASALNNWAFAKNPCQPVMELAKHLNIQTVIKAEIVEELRSISAFEIMTAFKKMSLEIRNGVNNDVIDAVFKPCIEVDLEGQPAFMTKSPMIIMNSGNFNRVPLMIGSNNIEDANLKLMNKNYASFDKINDNVRLLVPRCLAAEDKLSENIGQQLLKFYLGGEARLTEETRTQYLQLISDYYFSYYVNKSVRMHIEVAPEIPIYYYIVNRAPEWALPKDVNFLGTLEQRDEVPVVFRIEMPETCKDCRDFVTTRNRVVKMWTNFAKTGNPTPDDDDPLLQITWDPVENKDKLNYLSIGSELTKGRNPFHDRMKFWDKLHQDHKFLRTLVYFNDIGVSW